MAEIQNSVFREVGRIKDAHGLKGELFVRLYAGRADWLDRFKDGYLISPDETEVQHFEVEKASPHKDGLILKMGLNDRTPAEKLKGYKLRIGADLLVADEGDDFFLDEVLGFRFFDSESKKVGKAVGFSSNSFQDLIEVEIDGRVFSVPFVTPLIEKIDFENQEVRMRVPIGLLGEE